MNLTVNDHFQACSVAALNGVSSGSPKDVLMAFITQSLKQPKYCGKAKRMVDSITFGYYVHVFFVGPDMRTLPKGHNHYSNVGSCDQLAAYIRLNNLGPVIETEGRWNHRHSERKPGQGDLIAYIWSPDPEAFEKWYLANKSDVGGTHLQKPPTTMAGGINGFVDGIIGFVDGFG